MRYEKQALERYHVLDNGCWQWDGYIDKNGYGTVWFESKHWLAHRVFYNHYKKDLDTALTLDHLCKNRSCVNPDHLEQISQSENSKRGKRDNHSEYCNNGHLKDRVRMDRGYEYKFCSICKNEYHRKYRQDNLDKIRKTTRESQRKYYAKKRVS